MSISDVLQDSCIFSAAGKKGLEGLAGPSPSCMLHCYLHGTSHIKMIDVSLLGSLPLPSSHLLTATALGLTGGLYERHTQGMPDLCSYVEKK